VGQVFSFADHTNLTSTPYRATGNISTEDIVYALHGMGYQTGVDVDKLAKVGGWISEQLHKSNISRAGAGLLAKAKRLEASAAQ
jgi:hydroxymethylglutaryl-CoA lyase